jgi:hypothetical protein
MNARTATSVLGLLALVAQTACPSPGLAAEELSRYAIVVGANHGLPGSVDLRFAERDAHQVHQVLGELGGVDEEHAVLLTDPDAARFWGALDEMDARMREAAAEGRRTFLLLYFSGHATTRGIELGAARIPLAQLKRYLEESAATVRFAVIDACYSGAIVRAKGSRAAEAFPLEFDDQLDVRGYAILTSSSATEVSQEADALGGSVFTHYVLSGLRGDADVSGDARVTLSELYSYTYRRSVVRTGSRFPQAQHPTIDLDLQGHGDPVLSDLGRANAALDFPSALTGEFLIYHRGRDQLIAEVVKRPGTERRLAMNEGRVAVFRREGDRTWEAVTTLSEGERRDVSTLDFVAVDRLAMRDKGARSQVTLGVGLHGFSYLSSAVRDQLVGPLMALDVSVGWRPVRAWPIVGLARFSGGYGLQSVRVDAARVEQSVSLLQALVGIGSEHWWRRFRLSPWLGGGALWARRSFSEAHRPEASDQDSVQAVGELGLTLGWAPTRRLTLSLDASLGYTPFEQDVTGVHQGFVRGGALVELWL